MKYHFQLICSPNIKNHNAIYLIAIEVIYKQIANNPQEIKELLVLKKTFPIGLNHLYRHQFKNYNHLHIVVNHLYQ